VKFSRFGIVELKIKRCKTKEEKEEKENATKFSSSPKPLESQ